MEKKLVRIFLGQLQILLYQVVLDSIRHWFFLKSFSKFATKPDINMVIVETTKRNVLDLSSSVSENRINRYTPAVTSVEEWTKADTGVGAAIAAGNHAEWIPL